MGKLSRMIFICGLAVFLLAGTALAAETVSEGSASHGSIAGTLVGIAVLLMAGKISSLIERFGQPSVLGELVAGVALGNLALIGINWFEPLKTDQFIHFLAEFGVIILLFQVGLESNIKQMMRVGGRAFAVAIIGVVAPFVLGTYVVGPMLMPGLDQNAYLFLGAALTATSVGITARVFKDLNKLHTREAQIVLGAAVIDDVIGLIILAVVSAVVTVGSITLGGISLITGKAILFLVGSIIVGQISAPLLGRLLSNIHTGVGMKFAMALSFALVFAAAAGAIGLAPIVGAFAAGLVLDPVHFRFFSSEETVEKLVENLAHFLVPIFFVYTGLTVSLSTLFNPQILGVALGITVIAFIGKLVSGLAAGNVSKALVGFGMVPRGEVGLIFATIGRSLGVVNDEIFSVIVIMVIFTTLLTPPILTYLLKKQPENIEAQPVQAH
jgi:Kef-type K+ transport system membrane component KefB